MFNQFNRNNQGEVRRRLGAAIETAACLPHAERTYALEQIKKLTQDLILLLERKRSLQVKMAQQAPLLSNIARSSMAGEMLRSLEKSQHDLAKDEDVSPPKSPISGSPNRATVNDYEKLCSELKEVSEEIKDSRESLKELKDLIRFSDDLDIRMNDSLPRHRVSFNKEEQEKVFDNLGSDDQVNSNNNNNGNNNTFGGCTK